MSALLRAAELSPAGADRSRRLAQAAAVGAAFSLETNTVSQLLSNAGEASPESATYLLTAVAAAFVLLNGDGDVITAHRLLSQAIEDQARPDRISDTGVFEAVSGLFLMCRLGGRPELWTSFHAAISGFAPDVPEDLYLLGQTCANPVRTAAGVLPLVDAAIAGLRSETDHLRILIISSTAHFTDRQPGCREALWRVVREGRRGSGVAPLITALDHLGLDAWSAGQWDQAQELADEGLELSLAHGYPLLTWAFRYRQALIAAACGAYDGAHTLTDEMLRWAAPRRIGQAGLAAHHVGSVAALGRGDFEDAYQHATAISPAGVLASHVPLALWVLMDLVEAAVRTGRHTEAAAHVTAMRDAGIAAISPRLALLAAESEAITTPDGLGPGYSRKRSRSPALTASRSTWPGCGSSTANGCGAPVPRRGHGPSDRGAGDLRTARCQAVGRPRRRRAARGRPDHPRADQRARDSLTAQEREIAMLAAAGMSNKEIGQRLFLSHRTVGAHLYQIFPKLGITSRAALRDALAELPEPLRARSQ